MLKSFGEKLLLFGSFQFKVFLAMEPNTLSCTLTQWPFQVTQTTSTSKSATASARSPLAVLIPPSEQKSPVEEDPVARDEF